MRRPAPLAGCAKLPSEKDALEVQRKEPIMKKNSISAAVPKKRRHRKRTDKNRGINRRYSGAAPEQTIGLDLGDKTSRYFGLNQLGEETKEASVATTKKGLSVVFGKMRRSRVALEVGTHSPWVSRLLENLGH